MLLQSFSGLKPNDRFKLKNFEKLKRPLDKKLIVPRAIRSRLPTVVAIFEQKFQENKLLKASLWRKICFHKVCVYIIRKISHHNIWSKHPKHICIEFYNSVLPSSLTVRVFSLNRVHSLFLFKVTSSLYLHRHNKVCL